MKILDDLERASKDATYAKWDISNVYPTTIWSTAWYSTSPLSESKKKAESDAELIALMRNNIDALVKVARIAIEVSKYPNDDEPYDDLKEALHELRGENQ